jgi:hypothetical protein
VFLYNNGAAPGWTIELLHRFPSVRIAGDGTNVGFARGANAGIRAALAAGCDAVLLVNSDATVTPEAIEILAATRGDIVNPLILTDTEPERIWFNGGGVSFIGRGTHPGLHRVYRQVALHEPVSRIGFATGCVLLVRRHVFERIGFLDETFYSYSEDLDFCLRATARGFRIVINRAAVAHHGESLSVKANVGKAFRDYYVLRNRLLILRKHFRTNLVVVRAFGVFLVEVFPRIVFFGVTGQWGRAAACLRGLLDGTRGKGGRRYPERANQTETA